jgi:hypothetical protein
VEQAIGHLVTAGRCAAGAGCCSGSGTFAGLPARWSASAGSCTGSHLKEHRRHPDWPIRIGPADASPSKQWHNRPARPSGLRRWAPPPRMHLPSAPSCARGRLAGARRRPGRTVVPGRAPSTADVAAPDPSVCLSVALAHQPHQAPDLAAVDTDVGLDVAAPLDDGRVDAEQLRAPLQRRGDRPRVSRVVQFPGPHADSLVEHTFEVQWGKWDKQAPTRLGRNGDNLQLP